MNVRKVSVTGCLLMAVGVVVAILVSWLLIAVVASWAYNIAFVPWLHWPPLTLREAFGLVVLATIAVGLIAGPSNFYRKQ